MDDNTVLKVTNKGHWLIKNIKDPNKPEFRVGMLYSEIDRLWEEHCKKVAADESKNLIGRLKTN